MTRTYLKPNVLLRIDELRGWMENESRPVIVERSIEHTYRIYLRYRARRQRRLYQKVMRMSERNA